jgi:antitoxin component YwqK of YwqJK toxin-antitoxin module
MNKILFYISSYLIFGILISCNRTKDSSNNLNNVDENEISNHIDYSQQDDCKGFPNCDKKEGIEVSWSGGTTDYMVNSEEFLNQIPNKYTGYAKFCENNKLKRYISCKNGKADGITIQYNCEGGYDEQYFKNSIAEGTWINYNSSNEQNFVRNFKNGLLEGEMIYYYENHWAKEYEGTYLKGKLHGKSINYFKSGKIQKYEEYKNGITILSKSYYEHGQLKSEMIYKNGIIDKWIDYDEYGNITSEMKERDPIIINRP